MRIDVIVNPTARRYERSPSLVQQLSRTTRDRAVFHTTRELRDLDVVCAEAAARGSELVVLSGGDGSLMAGTTAVARAFGEKLPKIGFLPAGTAAVISRNWGISGDPVELLERILRRAPNLSSVRRPTLRVVAERPSGSEERVGFIFGTGLVAKFFDVYYEDGARGNLGAAMIVARIFAESFVGGAFARRVLDPLGCTIEVDGKKLAPEAFSLVCSAVVRNLGLHMIVTHRAGEDYERPHFIANALPTKRLGVRMPLVLAGKSIGGEGSFDDLAREMSVRFSRANSADGANEKGAAEGPYVLDGDMFRASSVRVSAGPVIDIVMP